MANLRIKGKEAREYDPGKIAMFARKKILEGLSYSLKVGCL